MTATQHVATLHPQTVTELSMAKHRRRRQQRENGRSRNGEITTTKHDAALLAHAHAVVGDDKGRIELLPDGGITIHNNSDWKRRR